MIRIQPPPRRVSVRSRRRFPDHDGNPLPAHGVIPAAEPRPAPAAEPRPAPPPARPRQGLTKPLAVVVAIAALPAGEQAWAWAAAKDLTDTAALPPLPADATNAERRRHQVFAELLAAVITDRKRAKWRRRYAKRADKHRARVAAYKARKRQTAEVTT